MDALCELEGCQRTRPLPPDSSQSHHHICPSGEKTSGKAVPDPAPQTGLDPNPGMRRDVAVPDPAPRTGLDPKPGMRHDKPHLDFICPKCGVSCNSSVKLTVHLSRCFTGVKQKDSTTDRADKRVSTWKSCTAMQGNIQESVEEFAEFKRAALTISMRPDGTAIVGQGLPKRIAKRAEKHKARVQEEVPDCAEYKMSNDFDDADDPKPIFTAPAGAEWWEDHRRKMDTSSWHIPACIARSVGKKE